MSSLRHRGLGRYLNRGAILVIALVAILGCSDATSTGPRCSNGETVPVTISNARSQPTLAWATSCPAWVLYVTYIDSTSTVVAVWNVAIPTSANEIHSPVDYGTLPTGAQASVPPASLVPGRTYSVTVSGWDALNGRPAFIGVGTFVH